MKYMTIPRYKVKHFTVCFLWHLVCQGSHLTAIVAKDSGPTIEELKTLKKHL